MLYYFKFFSVYDNITFPTVIAYLHILCFHIFISISLAFLARNFLAYLLYCLSTTPNCHDAGGSSSLSEFLNKGLVL